MFEGDKSCELCKKHLGVEKGNFGVSLAGYTHIFCDKCYSGRKEEVKVMLNRKN